MDTVLSRDCTRIAIETSGSGPPLVLVNGALSDRSAVVSLRPYLDAQFTLFAYDRRGRGGSGDTAPYAVEREIEDLAAVIGAAGAPAFVFGHSGGAILALHAARSGVPMRRLAVNEPPFIVSNGRALPPADVTSRLEALIAAGDREAALRLFLGTQVGLPEPVLQQMSQSPIWPAMLALAHTVPYDSVLAGTTEFPIASLSAISVPTLVLHGGASFPWIATTARAVAAALPNATLAELEGQPHAPAAAILAPALLGFFLAEN